MLAITLNVHNWSHELITHFRRLGLDFPIRCDMAEPVDMQAFDEFLLNKQRQDWLDLDVCPRTCTDRVRLCTYQQWFSRPGDCKLTYLRLPVAPRDMKEVMRFRVGCHSLPIEMGRRQRTPRNSRVCTLCDAQSLGDERHLLLECPALGPIRARYPDLLAHSQDTMRHLLWHKDQMLVFRFVRECLDFHDSASPSAIPQAA